MLALTIASLGLVLTGCGPKGATKSPATAQADSSPAVTETPEEQAAAPTTSEAEPAAAQPEAIAAVPPPPSVELRNGTVCPNGAKPGDSWKVDCNTCTCSPEGEMQCTLVACMEQEEGSESSNACPDGVSAGETWKDACNTCRCDEAGYAVCTLRACVD